VVPSAARHASGSEHAPRVAGGSAVAGGPTHAAAVSAWLGDDAATSGREELLARFERAFSAVWREAYMTLGEVTLGAIGRRVLFVGQERFPALSTVSIASDGFSFEGFRTGTAGLDPGELREALRFLLLELLTVLGSLTAEVLSPGLHAALASVTPAGNPPADRSRDGQPTEPPDGVGKEPRL
jgi:hypothetical protein